jgi:RNA polymerase sigma factor (sigma-70 family)
MNKMSKAKDREFEEALKDEDNIKIINHVCKKYISRISAEDLHRCKLVALWDALRNFDSERKVKFTSFLYNCIDWECKRQLSEYKKAKRISTNLSVDGDCEDINICETLDWIDSLPEKLAIAIKQKFIYGYTVQEIAKKNNYSRETARQYVQKGIEKLKKRHG